MQQVQPSRINRIGILDIQQDLVERDAKFPAPVGECAALAGAEELDGGCFVRYAALVSVLGKRLDQARFTAVGRELELQDDAGHPVLQLQ